MRRSLLALLLIPLLAPGASGSEGRERESLQELLARLRANRSTVVSSLKGDVDALVLALEEAGVAHDLEALESTKRKLVQLGPETATLLVDQIEPGTEATDAKKLRALYVASALIELKSRAVTSRLIELAQAGSLEGRGNAIMVLGQSPEPERASPVLVGIFRGAQKELWQPALQALARLGGEANDKVLEEALADTRPEIVQAVLEAVSAARKVALAPRVLKLLAASNVAVQYQDGLMDFYRSSPEALDKATVAAWIRLGGEMASTPELRTRVFAFLAQNVDRLDTEAKKLLKGLSSAPAKEISEGALVVLVVAGDRGAKKDLIAPYDEAVDRNRDWPSTYIDRGDVLYRIGDYTQAIADYKKAIQLGADNLSMPLDRAYVGLARAYAMSKRWNDAYTTLDRAPLTAKQLKSLRNDPAFAKMVDQPKYRALFEGK